MINRIDLLELANENTTNHFLVNIKQIHVKEKSNKQITSLNINNQTENNPKTISEAFNVFFSQTAKDTDKKIIPANKTYEDYFYFVSNKFSFSNLYR